MLREHGSTSPGEVESLLRQALAGQQAHSVLGDDHTKTLKTKLWLALVLQDRGEMQEAARLLEAARAGFNNRSGTNQQDAEASLVALIDLYDAWGKPDKAAEFRLLLQEAGGADEASE